MGLIRRRHAFCMFFIQYTGLMLRKWTWSVRSCFRVSYSEEEDEKRASRLRRYETLCSDYMLLPYQLMTTAYSIPRTVVSALAKSRGTSNVRLFRHNSMHNPRGRLDPLRNPDPQR